MKASALLSLAMFLFFPVAILLAPASTAQAPVQAVATVQTAA